MFVVFVENVPKRLRGRLRLWLTEIRAGVFIGKYSIKTRNYIWSLVESNIAMGNAAIAWEDKSDRGFNFSMMGDHNYKKVEYNNMPFVSVIPEISNNQA